MIPKTPDCESLGQELFGKLSAGAKRTLFMRRLLAQSRRSTKMLTSSLKSKPGYPGPIGVPAGSLQRDAVVLPARGALSRKG